MCDTFVALGTATTDGSMIFGKNSDRPYDEVQNIQFFPGMKYSIGEKLKCTYIEIPQATETISILLSQPSWMYGGEMGCNAKGVVIGNEAVFTKEPDGPPALLGMDLLRLGLERGKTAEEAMEVITSLLETHGQGGGCGEGDSSFMYHNSFLIADAKEAWILETADKWWVAEHVKDCVRNISNALSIEKKFDRLAKGTIEHAIESGYCRDDSSFNFARGFSSGGVADYSSQFSREGRGFHLLKEDKGKITPAIMMEILRDHDGGICMHGGFRSTASQVSLVNSEDPCHLHWFTGTAYPCASFFKPFSFEISSLSARFKASNQSDLETLWWSHERAISKSTSNIRKNLRRLEEKYLQEVQATKDCSQRSKLHERALEDEIRVYQSVL